MQLDSILTPYLNVAQVYLDEKRIREILFSRGTYHVHVVDKSNEDPAWAFIQLNDNQTIKDFFCSCQTESMIPCEHLAAALLAIFQNKNEPLHKRFEHSFWYKITQFFASKYGYDFRSLNQKEDLYQLKPGENLLFSIEGKDDFSKKILKEFLKDRSEETEETSIKFSNLPKKELTLWREGRPSEQLRYELSYWSDLAKWLMILQEGHHEYTLKFTYKKDFPSSLKITFEGVEAFFNLNREVLLEIIPYLSTIKSPLEVHHTSSLSIEKILYDKKEKMLLIHPKKNLHGVKKESVKGEQIGDWIYLPKKGFYHKTSNEISTTRKILSHSIDQELEKNTSFFHQHLKETELNLKPIKPNYQIEFDENWNLHVHLYLFDPFDLKEVHSAFFGKWIYVDQKGFFRLKESIFHQPSLHIEQDKVTEFIRQYRYWLNSQKGFEVHLAPLETHVSYKLNSHKQLIFSSRLPLQGEVHFDFGEWIYIKDQGFYSKPRHSSPIQGGITVNKENISKFIHLNKEDLESIPGFFASKCPLKKVSLHLRGDLESQEICIEPHYEFHKEYEEKGVLFFEHYSFVQAEGFYLLPKEVQLPKGFRKKVRIQPKDQSSFLAFQFKTLKPFITELDPSLQIPTELNLALESFKEEHFQLKYENSFGLTHLQPLFKAIKEKQPYYLSKAGLIQLNHPRFSWIQDLQADQINEDGVKLTPLDLIRIEAIDSSFTSGEAKILDQINASQDLTLPSLRGFKTKLRPYQQVGLSWLWKLFMYNLSGILCDDMGLGKTHQAMALMASVKNQKFNRPYPGFKAPKKKFLIVCPTSVIYHWQDKLKEFYPSLKVLTFYGLNRSLKRFQQQFDVLLTSYGILRIDQKAISKLNFELVIYDEVQIAKNHRSLTYQALLKINSKMKLGLTGTPIENNLRELKTLFDLIIPTYLPSEEKFRDFFTNPIERDRDEQRIMLLKKVIAPFILRRKKEEVAKDLPDKVEQVSHCEMKKEQAQIYQEHLEQSRNKLLKDLKDNEKPVPYIHVFALLNKLKQICNHPKSLDAEKYAEVGSGKWELFIELLKESRESGRKVVVFSQYLKMIELMTNYLKEHDIGYATIQGSTKDRRTPLKRFQKDPECEVFVGSLKAVGLGIDLTAASVVIHYDRWWNAARERQATDRVHRIGQQKGVLVFKLVTLNSLEEKIDRIIAAKDKLMEDIVGTSDEAQIKAFSREDLIEILQFVHQDIYTSS